MKLKPVLLSLIASLSLAHGDEPKLLSPATILRYPIVTAPLLKTAPTVDGTVDKAEWLSAAGAAPLVDRYTGLLTDDACRYWIGYTADALHISFRFDRPAYAVAPGAEDRLEVWLQPGNDAPDYFVMLYPNGQRKEGVRFADDKSWTWNGAARVTETGWEGELTLPFASLNLKTPPKSGDQWRLLVFSNRKTPTGELAFSSYLRGAGWPVREDRGILRFGDANTPAVRIIAAGAITPADAGAQIEVIGGASQRQLKLTSALYQPEGKIRGSVTTLVGETIVPKDVDLNFFQALDNMTVDKALANYKAVKSWDEALTVAQAENRRFNLIAPAPPGQYIHHFVVTDSASGEVTAAGSLPFVQRPAFNLSVEPYLLTAKAILITTDYRRMTTIPTNAIITAELLAKDGDKVLEKASGAVDAKTGRTVLSLPCKDRFGETVRVRARMVESTGKVVVEETRPVELANKPSWVGNTIGVTDDPLPPWKPIALSGDTAKVLLREIRFGKSSLPSAITSRGKALLTAPMSLTLEGKELVWKRSLDEKKPGKVTWTSQAKAGGVSFAMKATMEYDGMLRYDLTLDPGNKLANLKNLVLSIPYRSAGVIPREIVTLKEFKPNMNLGDMDTGIQWFAEWAKGWQIGELPPIEMTPSGETINWKIRFIGKEGKTIREPLTLTFGMIPLPVHELDLAHYNVQQRHSHPGGATAWKREDATCSLSYSVKGNITPEEGSLAFRASWYGTARLVQFGQGEDSVNAYFVNGPMNGRKLELWLTRGDMQLQPAAKGDAPTGKYDRLALIPDMTLQGSTWQPIGFTWKRNGENVDVEIITVEPGAKVRSERATVSWALWQKATSSESFVFAGQGNLAVDDVIVSKKALPAAILATWFDKTPSTSDDITLIDPLEKIRLHRGKFITEPLKISGGRGGVAGGKYSGLFIETIEGYSGCALYLPTGEKTAAEVTKAYGVHQYMPIHEQFTGLAGYYSIEHMPSPILRDTLYQPVKDQGFGIDMYGGFSLNGKADPGVMGFADELVLPGQIAGAGVSACFATPAVDYYVDAWKRNIDYYECQGGMYDNTVNCRVECKNVAHGCGWYDEKGELHGRWPIFGARELSKRFRWLWHVYVPQKTGKEGLYILHAGARGFYAVSSFCDVVKFGEGWVMGSKFELKEPEQWWTEGWQWRLGVPGEILGKGGFSYNWLMTYGLLYGQPFRASAALFNPVAWHIDPTNPTAKNGGPFDPYFAKEGVPDAAAPLMLWWQLQDDFNTHTAEFHPFWNNQDTVKLNHAKLRSSFYLHKGKSALFIVSNFDPQPVNAEVTVDFAKLGLGGKKLRVFDAWLDDDYPVDGNKIKLSIPGWQYRLVRIELQ